MMALEELKSASEISSYQSQHGNVLICFSATWCGPCKASKPQLEQMAQEMSANSSLDVRFGIVYEHNLGDDLHKYNVRAFPTYVLYSSGSEVGRVMGANLPEVRALIMNHPGCQKSNVFESTAGHSLGGASGPPAAESPEDMRRRRLARMEEEQKAAQAAKAAAQAAQDTPTPMETEQEEEKPPPAEAEAATDTQTPPPEAADPAANVDKEALQTLTDTMGFPPLRATKGLLNGGNNVEAAVDWIMQHQDDADIDDPIAPPSQQQQQPASGAEAVAQSYKCNDCGKILSNMANLELHANKTGHSDFEESTQAVTPLTPEEKAAKVAQLKELLASKRAEREAQEKEEAVDREKRRRFMGKEMAKTREEMEKEQRKREATQRRREKEAFKKERERIKKELEKDKAERRANKGKLGSKLGVDGYNPDGIQYDDDEEQHHKEGDGDADSPKPAAKKRTAKSALKVDECIAKVGQYRAGGDGLKCLKILLAYVKNIVEHPEDPKFRTIKTDNKAYRTKIKPFIGGKQLLLAVGFHLKEGGDALVLDVEDGSATMDVLKDARTKLEAAIASY